MSVTATTSAMPSIKLEPDTPAPEPSPYRPSAAGIVGTVAVTGVTTMAGMAVGGLLGVAAQTSGAGRILTAVAGFTPVLAGLAGPGILSYNYGKSNHLEHETARIDAQYGTPIKDFSTDLVTSFDHNRNGQIDLDNRTGLSSQDERVLLENRENSELVHEYDWLDNESDLVTREFTENRSLSAANVWDGANANNDRVISLQEIQRLAAAFDADHSGALTTDEKQALNDAHPIIVEAWTRN